MNFFSHSISSFSGFDGVFSLRGATLAPMDMQVEGLQVLRAKSNDQVEGLFDFSPLLPLPVSSSSGVYQERPASTQVSSPRQRHVSNTGGGRNPSPPRWSSFDNGSPAISNHSSKLGLEERLSSIRALYSSLSLSGYSRSKRSPLHFVWESHIWSSQGLWLFLYFSFNLLLTLSNKSSLNHFPFPYTLTSLHTFCSAVGCYILRSYGFYVSKPLTVWNELVLSMFSVLYAVNIAVSNLSLHLVTVPFHQVVRAITPIFTILISTFLLDKRTTWTKALTLAPVISGVVIATYGDYYFTFWGLLLTLLGTFLAALKTIFTNVLQSPTKPTGLALFPRSRSFNWRELFVPPSLGLHPLDLLMRMSSLAFVQCVIFAQLSGELDSIRQAYSLVGHPHIARLAPQLNSTTSESCTASFLETTAPNGIPAKQMATLLLNGCIAFGLNIVSLTANGKIGALSMTVAANIKQVLTILFAVSLFNLTITPANAVGITITLWGGAWYAWVEYREKQIARSSTAIWDGETRVGSKRGQ